MIPLPPNPLFSSAATVERWHRLFADASTELVGKFNDFHAANTALYDRIKSKAAEARTTGRNKYSMWVIINVLRWDQEIVCNGDDFKISNDFIALYARMLVWDDPGYDGFFSIKQMNPERSVGKQSRYLEGNCNVG